MHVAFLGLGIMGRPMALNLVKAGHEVTVWNRTPGKELQGARVARTPAEAASQAEVVWLCVSDTRAVEEVLFGPEGVEKSLAAGRVVVDSSTIAPAATRQFAERVRARGADFVDAPMTGSKAAAESGQLVFIAGGRVETLAQLEPLFRAMGRQVVRVGEAGMGSSAKISMNLMIALTFQGFAEGLTLAARMGVEPTKLIELVQSSMVRSGIIDYKAPFILKRDFTPNFPTRLMLKDIHLMLEAAKQVGARLPGIETTAGVYTEAVQAGLGELDFSSMIQLLERGAGEGTPQP
jgi:3-hydroxyisobutyrate dehydrogenase-like beta-hydroxyacid dehydrogenase